MTKGDNMEPIIYRTKDGLKQTRMHKHDSYEIIYFFNTKATFSTKNKKISLSSGNIIIVPPGVTHFTISDESLDCIYIQGNFNLFFCSENPVVLHDTPNGDGRLLATLLYNNRFSNKEYILSLCDSYTRFLAMNMQLEDNIGRAVNNIINEITENAFLPDIDLCKMLSKSGYAEDYIRACFKRITGQTPTSFLSHIRIKHACFLMEAYGNLIPISQIAENCGYMDYEYFSKKFKSIIGISPREYRKSII